MIKLYHGLMTRSARVIWLLEELGDVPYQVEVVDFTMPTKGVYAQKTPTGKFPTVTDGAVTIYESGAINDYLLDRYGKGRLMPARDSNDWPVYQQWCIAAESSIATPLNMIGSINFFAMDTPEVEVALPRLKVWAQSALRSLADDLGDRDYLLASGFSNADIMMGYTMNMARSFGAGLDAFPNLDAYLDRLLARPGFQKAMGDQF